MRIISVLTALILIMETVAGCGAEGYQYIDGDGRDYIILGEEHNNDTDNIPNLDGMEHVPIISANSMEEMITKIKTGNYSEQDLYYLAKWRDKDEQGRIVLPDLDNLLSVTHPDDFQWTYVRFFEEGVYNYYAHVVSDKDDYSIYILIGEKEPVGLDFPTFLDKMATAAITENSTEEEIEAARSAIYFDVWNGDRVYYYYIQRATAVFAVNDYRAQSKENPGEFYSTSFTLHRQVGDNLYMYIYISGFEEEPSLDWLTSFGVKPYEG